MSANSQGLELKDYGGSKSTLCTGCGHDSVTNHIIKAYYKSGVHPFQVAKLSGIGCSSKTPAYFLKSSHGFNTIHGRMAAVALGAGVVNKNLKLIGVSGDGDTASIGLGGFIHLLRRNLPMVYLIENNGVYGLTKGQFSATADINEVKKDGEKSLFHDVDLCRVAIDAGCGFVARSFSGDAKQLVPLIQAAIEHNGTAVIDVISPCITYANHAGSHKSYDYVKEHQVALQELGFISEKAPANFTDLTSGEVTLADGSLLKFRKLAHNEHNVGDQLSAIKVLLDGQQKQEIVTGLIYFNNQRAPLQKQLNLAQEPLTALDAADLRPTTEQLDLLLHKYR